MRSRKAAAFEHLPRMKRYTGNHAGNPESGSDDRGRGWWKPKPA